jgi:hypothetical protein
MGRVPLALWHERPVRSASACSPGQTALKRAASARMAPQAPRNTPVRSKAAPIKRRVYSVSGASKIFCVGPSSTHRSGPHHQAYRQGRITDRSWEMKRSPSCSAPADPAKRRSPAFARPIERRGRPHQHNICASDNRPGNGDRCAARRRTHGKAVGHARFQPTAAGPRPHAPRARGTVKRRRMDPQTLATISATSAARQRAIGSGTPSEGRPAPPASPPASRL